jgi:hypothetical protein
VCKLTMAPSWWSKGRILLRNLPHAGAAVLTVLISANSPVKGTMHR